MFLVSDNTGVRQQLAQIWAQPREGIEADYVRLTHESVLAFWKSHPGANGPKLERAIAAGHFTPLPEIPGPTFERMIAAAKASRHLPIEQKRRLA